MRNKHDTPAPSAQAGTFRPDSEAALKEAFLTRITFFVLLGFILLQATVFLACFAAKSFWLDEILSLDFTGGSLGELYRKLTFDLHPPGYFLLLWVWRRIFPVSEVSVRTLSLLLALPLTPLLYALVRRVWSRAGALWACAFVTLSAFHAQFAAEARMYSGLETLAVLSTLLLVIASDRPRPGRAGLWYACAMAACLYFHYYGFFVLAGHLLYLALRGRRTAWRPWLGIYAVTGVLFLPWAGVLARQIAGGGSGWIQQVQPGGASFQFLGNVLVFFNLGEWSDLGGPLPTLSLLYLVLPWLGVGIWAALRRRAAEGAEEGAGGLIPRSGIIPIMFIVPGYLALTVSQIKSIVMSRYLIETLPFYCALLGMAVSSLRPRGVRRALGLALVIFMAVGLTMGARLRPREDWRGLAETVAQMVPPERMGEFGIYCTDPNAVTCVKFYTGCGRSAGLKKVPVVLIPGEGLTAAPPEALPPLGCIVARSAEALNAVKLPPGYERMRMRVFRGGIFAGFFKRQALPRK